jgi:ribosome-binding factor A
MKHANGKPPSQRQRRVGEEIRHALAWTIERGELRDPVLAGVPITVTEVRASPDLKNATAFVTPLGGGDMQPILEALRRAAPFLRHEIASRLDLKYVPRLSFEPDTSFDEASRIDALLHSPKVAQDLRPEPDGEDNG